MNFHVALTDGQVWVVWSHNLHIKPHFIHSFITGIKQLAISFII